jgi:aminoglycoside phosphotransferase (APT) family kinase protein
VASDPVSAIPEQHRDAARAALREAFGPSGATALVPVTGGASGALAYRVETDAGPHLLRIEGIRGAMRNPHQTACLVAAAEAGIAPPVRHADDDTGLLVVGWIDQRPLAEHPGGPESLAADAGALIRRLHELDRFPANGDHLQNLRGLAGIVAGSGRVAPGLLDPHRAALEQLVAAYPWDPADHVACHTDPHLGNLLSDGERLWLVDWETAGANDPMVDLASLCAHLAPTPGLRDALLTAALGRAPDEEDRARLVLASQLGRAFAGLLLLLITTDPQHPVQDDLTALSIEDFGARLAAGELVAGRPATTIAFAKICLEALVAGMDDPEVVAAMALLSR